MRQPSRVLSLRIPRWRFQERVHSLSISKEMWITGCGNYDFWPNHALQRTAAGRRGMNDPTPVSLPEREGKSQAYHSSLSVAERESVAGAEEAAGKERRAGV